MAKVASQANGLCRIMADFGVVTKIVAHLDSTAAIGIVHRRGCDKTRHIKVQHLWIQDTVKRKNISIENHGAIGYPTDMLMKGLKRETLDEHVQFLNGHIRQAKSPTALSIHVVKYRSSMGVDHQVVSSDRQTSKRPMSVKDPNYKILQMGGDT